MAEILTGAMNDTLYENGDLLSKPSTANYLGYLATYTGGASFGDINSTSTVLDLQIDNISVSPGANIVLGSSTADSRSVYLYCPKQLKTIEVFGKLT